MRKNKLTPKVKNRITIKRFTLYAAGVVVIGVVFWKFILGTAAVVYPTGVFGQYTTGTGPTLTGHIWEATITIDHTKVMDSVDLIDFPLLVELEEDDLKSVSNGGVVEDPNGYDILFCGAGDACLDHQIESYDPATGKLVAWVRLPILYHDVDTELKITCGNSTIMNDHSTENVWSSSYESVWHMNDNPSTSNLIDYAGANDGQAFGNMNSNDLVQGKIGGAIDFDGNNDYYAIENKHYSNQGEITALTVSAWVKTSFHHSSWTENWSIIDFDRSEYFNFFVHGKGYLSFSTKGNAINDFHGGNQGQVNNDQWHHVVGVFDGQNKKLYIDGVLAATSSNPHNGLPLGSGMTRFGFIGEGSEATSFNGVRNNKYYEGMIDELRLMNTNLTDGWIATEFNNQSDPSSFYTLGEPNNLPVELVDFGAQMEDDQVNVRWATASERDNDYFTIERSTNGASFEEVGEVKGSGTTTDFHSYEFVDYEPLSGLSYYRLRQTDINGEFEVFNAVAVLNEQPVEKMTIEKIGPNPFRESFNLTFTSSEAAAVDLVIVDMNGIQVFTDRIETHHGENDYSFYGGAEFKSGAYYLFLNQNGETIAQSKLMKN